METNDTAGRVVVSREGGSTSSSQQSSPPQATISPKSSCHRRRTLPEISWKRDLERYRDQMIGRKPEDVRKFSELMDTIAGDYESADTWWSLLENEEMRMEDIYGSKPSKEVVKRREHETVLLCDLYDWATRVVPQKGNKSKPAFVNIWLGHARQQWIRGRDDALDAIKALKTQQIGLQYAQLYIEWAGLEACSGNIHKAISVIGKGIREGARPLQILQRIENDLKADRFTYQPFWKFAKQCEDAGNMLAEAQPAMRMTVAEHQLEVPSGDIPKQSTLKTTGSTQKPAVMAYSLGSTKDAPASISVFKETHPTPTYQLRRSITAHSTVCSKSSKSTSDEDLTASHMHQEACTPASNTAVSSSIANKRAEIQYPKTVTPVTNFNTARKTDSVGISATEVDILLLAKKDNSASKLVRGVSDISHTNDTSESAQKNLAAIPEVHVSKGAMQRNSSQIMLGGTGTVSFVGEQSASMSHDESVAKYQLGQHHPTAAPQIHVAAIGKTAPSSTINSNRGCTPIAKPTERTATGIQPRESAVSMAPPPPVVINKPPTSSHRRIVEDENMIIVRDIRYTKLECIGKGGSSKVYKVMAPNKKIFALKRIRLNGRDTEAATGFLDEITLLTRLRGKPNIIQLIDSQVHQKDGIIYMVLECGDIDLARLLQRHEAARQERKKQLGLQQQGLTEVDENFIRMYWEQMLQAVDIIHRERIVHSDLKPANFLVVEGQLKLIDFGIAKAIQADTTSIARESQVGTLNYMSPEAITGGQSRGGAPPTKVGRASDIWSLGCILYQMVYGKTPFAHLPFIQKMHAITDDSYTIAFPPLSNPHLLDVITRCLARNPKARITMSELLDHPFLHPAREEPNRKSVSDSIELSKDQLRDLLHQIATSGVSDAEVNSLSEKIFMQLSGNNRENVHPRPQTTLARSESAHPKDGPRRPLHPLTD